MIARSIAFTCTTLLCATSCGILATDPGLPAKAEQFEPPAVFQHWWAMTQSCSGVTSDLSDVTWYHVPVGRLSTGDGEVVAYWSKISNRIVLIDVVRLDGAIVRHEMLHAILGTSSHPKDQFRRRCAGVVACDEGCRSLSSEEPSSSYQRVTPDKIEVEVSLSPAVPLRTVDNGFFQVIVKAHNSSTSPVVVILPRVGTADAPDVFSGGVIGGAGGPFMSERAWDYSRLTFAPGEVKLQIFDFSIDPTPQQGGLTPGAYKIEGSFAGHLAAPLMVQIQ